jgi:hypothetical protein
LTLDASALVAFERNDRRVVSIIARAREHDVQLVAPAGVIGQVWRDGRRQTRLARLLGSELVEIETLDDRQASSAAFRARTTSSTLRWRYARAPAATPY